MDQASFGIEELDRKFEILAGIGAGGMGRIYKVRHRYLEELRVIKTIRSNLQDEGSYQKRFLLEAKVAAQLDHPRIARIFDFGIAEDGTAYIVMEFVDGRDLGQLLKSGISLDLSDAVSIATQSLEALGYLHESRFVHRDISPDNIMLTGEPGQRPEIKLIDLGIVKPFETAGLTATGLFVGKLKYASPEQLSDSRDVSIGPASDLYSLGLVLYQLLTGHFPYQDDNEAVMVASHLFHAPRSFEETDPESRISDELRSVVLRALEKAPADRFATAEEFRRSLEEAAGRQPFLPASLAPGPVQSADLPAAPTLSAPTRAVPPSRELETTGDRTATVAGPGRRRRSRRLWLPAAALVVGLLGAAVWWSGALPEKRGPPAEVAEQQLGLPIAAAEQIDFGSYRALIIGNDSYEELPQLQTARSDAEELAKLLSEQYGFRVELLTDATRSQITTALGEAIENLTDRDNLLLYYAGHGTLDEFGRPFWQPVDAERGSTANWISVRYDISAELGRAKARNILVIADSCFSGAISEEVGPPPPATGDLEESIRRTRETLERRSRLALSSGGLRPVLDTGDGKHSVFSKVLLETLGANTRIVEASAFFPEIKRRVSAAASRFGFEQEPRLAVIPATPDEGGNFYFVPRS